MSFKHLLLVNWNIEIICSPFEDDIFLTQIKVKRRNCRCRFKWFYGFGKRKDLNNVWGNISLDSSDDAILITTCDVPGCVAGANKSQTTYVVISHSSWFNSASLYRVLCLGIYLYFTFLETIIWIKQSHVFKWLVSTLVYAVL